MSFLSISAFIFTLFFNSLKEWLLIFISPIRNLNVLWIIVPVWFNWFFAEFFQEKKGTSFGNAISNGVVPVFVGLDWTKYLTQSIIENNLAFSWSIFSKYFLCLIVMLYGIFIIVFGIKGKKFIHYFGRIREITYVLVVFSPVIYNIVPLSLNYILIVLVFFPIFYYLIEFIALFTPDPKSLIEDNQSSTPDKPKDDFDTFNTDFNLNPQNNTYGSQNEDFLKDDFNFNSNIQNNNNQNNNMNNNNQNRNNNNVNNRNQNNYGQNNNGNNNQNRNNNINNNQNRNNNTNQNRNNNQNKNKTTDDFNF